MRKEQTPQRARRMFPWVDGTARSRTRAWLNDATTAAHGLGAIGDAVGVGDELHRQLWLRYPDDAQAFEQVSPGRYLHGSMELKLKIMHRCFVVTLPSGKDMSFEAFLAAAHGGYGVA